MPGGASSISPLYTSLEVVDAAVKMLSSATNISSSVIARHIVWYEAYMNARLAIRYAVPVSLGPLADAALENIATAGTAYYLLGRGPSIEATQKSGWIALFKDRAESFLSAVCAGSATLVSSGQELSGLIIWSNTQNYTPTFGQFNENDAIVDPNRILDELDKKGIPWSVWW